jgi:hypothetical protein
MVRTDGGPDRPDSWEIDGHPKIAAPARLLLLAVMMLSLSGCAVMHKVMIKEDGKQAVLASTGWGLVGASVAVAAQLIEEKKYRDQGYIEIEEFEKTEGPKVEARAGISPPREEAPPVWNVGDAWTYQVAGISRGEHRQEIVGEEKIADTDAYVMCSDERTLYMDRSLNLVQAGRGATIEFAYSPPRQDYDWPLMVGKTWRAKGKIKTPSAERNFARQVVVKEYGVVRVPAGEFEAFYILTTAAPFVGPSIGPEPRLLEAWYAPSVRHHVKRVVYTEKGWIVLELTSFNAGPPEATKPRGTNVQDEGKPE